MAINDTDELVVRGNLVVGTSVQTYIHTLHFRHLTIPAGNPEQVLIDAWQAAAQTAWLAAHTSAYTLADITARPVCGSIPLRSPILEAVNVAGTRASPGGEALAQWLTVTVTENTDLAGRSRRGRFFVSGGFEVDLSGDFWVSTYTALVNTYNTGLITAFGPTGTNTDFRLVVHSRKLAVPGTQCQDSSRIVTLLSTRPRLTTQRSRRQRQSA